MNLIGYYLRPENVLLDVEVIDKQDALVRASAVVEQFYDIDRQRILAGLMRREQSGSTGVGHGIAIPHARLGGLVDPIVVAVRLTTPVDFRSLDGEPVDFLFIILVPEHATEQHLRILSVASEYFSEAWFRNTLRSATDARAIYRLLTTGTVGHE